jgi:nucleoside-diphosphate-sugar epimerase
VHERDVVAAIKLALRSGLTGALNLAAAAPFSFAQAIRRRHSLAIPLSPRLAQTLLDWSWRLTGFGGEPGWMQGLSLPLTLDCRRARQTLGWAPQHSAIETLSAA